MRHGLSSEGTILPCELTEELNRRYGEFQCVLRPSDTYDDWLCEVATASSVQVDVCTRQLIALTNEQADRATNRWQADRMLEAESIAERLPRSPAKVVRELKQFRQGAEWLTLRWEGLADVVEATGVVDDSQRHTALDLLGVPFDVRAAATDLDQEGKTPAEALAEVARREIAALEQEIAEDLSERDEDERTRAELGLGTPTAEMKLIQRYLSAAKRRHAWAKATMNKGGRTERPSIPTDERPQPAWTPLAARDEPAWTPLPPEQARGDVSLPTVVPLTSAIPAAAAPDPERERRPKPVAPAPVVDPTPPIATEPAAPEPPDHDPRR